MEQPKKLVSGPKFTLPHKKEIVITRNGSFSENGELVIKDLKNKPLLKVVAQDSTLHAQRLVINVANGNPILMLRVKRRSIHKRWQAFKGKIKSEKNLLFSAKIASNFQEGRDINVFLANNEKESVYDCKVTGDWRMKSCTVYDREGGIVAQMHKKRDVTTNGAFGVTVYPKVDYSFIAALFVILGEINSDQSVNDGGDHDDVVGPAKEQVGGGEEASEDKEEEEPEEEIGAAEDEEEEERDVEAAEDEEEEEDDDDEEEEEEL